MYKYYEVILIDTAHKVIRDVSTLRGASLMFSMYSFSVFRQKNTAERITISGVDQLQRATTLSRWTRQSLHYVYRRQMLNARWPLVCRTRASTGS